MTDGGDEALTFREVTPERWPDLERLFSARGGPKACWCMALRATRGEPVAGSAGKREAMRARVLSATPVGILAYRDETPVAWYSIAPKATYGRLSSAGDAGDVWSLTCFFVPRPERGCGLVARLIEAAVQAARAHRARLVEAYPVDVESPSYRFGGLVQSFARAGSRRRAASARAGTSSGGTSEPAAQVPRQQAQRRPAEHHAQHEIERQDHEPRGRRLPVRGGLHAREQLAPRAKRRGHDRVDDRPHEVERRHDERHLERESRQQRHAVQEQRLRPRMIPPAWPRTAGHEKAAPQLLSE